MVQPPSAPGVPPSTLSREEALAILPPDIRELVSSLPDEQLQQVLDQLLQANELSYRALNENDLAIIQVRFSLLHFCVII